MSDKVEEIRRIRVMNNDLWLQLLKIALKHAPIETKSVLADIRMNDQAISNLMGELVDE